MNKCETCGHDTESGPDCERCYHELMRSDDEAIAAAEVQHHED